MRKEWISGNLVETRKIGRRWRKRRELALGSTPPAGPSRFSISSAATREHYGTRDRMRRGFSEPQGCPNRRRRGYHRGGLRPVRPFVSAPRMGGTEPGRLAPSSL